MRMNKILIIDDSEDVLFAISEFFKFKGWEVYTASGVEKALEIIRKEYLDIIIIDYNMPYISGTTGVRLIRQINSEITIIALTIEGSEHVAEDFFNAGVNDFAIKPIKMLDLFFRINVHLTQNILKEKNYLKEISYPKGINKNTIELIKEKMEKFQEYISIENLSEITGLAPKTLNRYLNYLAEEKSVEIKIIYGKVGRPKNEYLWIKKREKREK